MDGHVEQVRVRHPPAPVARRDPGRAKVAPAGDADPQQRAERAGRDELLQRPRLAAKAVVLRDHHPAVRACPRLRDRARVLEAQREGLLREHVQAGGERLLGERAVGRGRRHEQHRVRVDRAKRLVEPPEGRDAELGAGPVARRRRVVDERGEPEAGRTVHELCPAPSPEPRPDLDQRERPHPRNDAGGDEEQRPGDRVGEVEQPVVVSRRRADEHVVDHLLEHPRRARVADEVGAGLAAHVAERHVVAEDVDLDAVLLDHGERVVRVRRLRLVVELDVGELRAADDQLLLLGRERLPLREVVDVALHEHVAPAGEVGILVADDRGLDRLLPHRVLGAVDEAGQVAVVEVAEPVRLVDRGDRALEPRHDLGRELEAEVHPLGADVEEDVAGGRDRVAVAGEHLLERVEQRRPRLPVEDVPRVGADPRDAGEPPVEVALADGADERGQVGQERADGLPALLARVHRHDEEDRVAGRGLGHGLRAHGALRITRRRGPLRLSPRRRSLRPGALGRGNRDAVRRDDLRLVGEHLAAVRVDQHLQPVARRSCRSPGGRRRSRPG